MPPKTKPPKDNNQVKKDYGRAIGTDLFGETVYQNILLRERFIEPPFTVLNTGEGAWRKRKNDWMQLGIRSEIGRTDLENTSMVTEWMKRGNADKGGSIFDPALCELLYRWFAPEGCTVLDPFAGGSVRGIVANYLGYKYTGIDIRPKQVESNREQALEILHVGNQPQWYTGDSNTVLDGFIAPFDFMLSCPPYADLEVYSQLTGDISNLPYHEFIVLYGSIINKACAILKPGALAVFVVGEVRDKKGNYIGFVPDTITLFAAAGMEYYNEAILMTSRASAVLRTKQFVSSKKLVKCHQNILVFKKPGNAITETQEAGTEDNDRT